MLLERGEPRKEKKNTMRLSKVVSSMASVAMAAAIPLTVKIPANGMECFYGQVHTIGSKIGFTYSVQAGGSFDIDLAIRSPDQNILYQQSKESQGEYAFAASQTGDYEFCFSNDMSTFSEKSIEFDLNIDSSIRAELPTNVGADSTGTVERSITKLESLVDELHRSLQYYKTRNNRNESTVKSTEARIFYFSIFEVLLMVGMGLLHVTIVQLFFTGSRKHLV